jgi:hypothetical protein
MEIEGEMFRVYQQGIGTLVFKKILEQTKQRKINDKYRKI